MEVWEAPKLNLDDPADVLAFVFGKLPAEVEVFPTENYFYWRLRTDSRDIWGNLRLASGRRDKGELSLGYEEHPPDLSLTGTSHAKTFSAVDGVKVTCPDPWTAIASVGTKSVRFHFQKVPQAPPTVFSLRTGEVFVERTCDESALHFLLIYNSQARCLYWVLDEADSVSEEFREIGKAVILGKRTGFLFWQETDRKVLAAVRRSSRDRNDYYDGPFDQLADNDAEAVRIQHFLELAYPEERGKIDPYGYFTDSRQPKRIAVMTYGVYNTPTAVLPLLRSIESKLIPPAEFRSLQAD